MTDKSFSSSSSRPESPFRGPNETSQIVAAWAKECNVPYATMGKALEEGRVHMDRCGNLRLT